MHNVYTNKRRINHTVLSLQIQLTEVYIEIWLQDLPIFAILWNPDSERQL